MDSFGSQNVLKGGTSRGMGHRLLFCWDGSPFPPRHRLGPIGRRRQGPRGNRAPAALVWQSTRGLDPEPGGATRFAGILDPGRDVSIGRHLATACKGSATRSFGAAGIMIDAPRGALL